MKFHTDEEEGKKSWEKRANKKWEIDENNEKRKKNTGSKGVRKNRESGQSLVVAKEYFHPPDSAWRSLGGTWGKKEEKK